MLKRNYSLPSAQNTKAPKSPSEYRATSEINQACNGGKHGDAKASGAPCSPEIIFSRVYRKSSKNIKSMFTWNLTGSANSRPFPGGFALCVCHHTVPGALAGFWLVSVTPLRPCWALIAKHTRHKMLRQPHWCFYHSAQRPWQFFMSSSNKFELSVIKSIKERSLEKIREGNSWVFALNLGFQQ